MYLTAEDLIRIAQWEPVATGFGRYKFTFARHVRPILDRIGVSEDTLCSPIEQIAYNVFENGDETGLSNYFAFFVSRPRDRGRRLGGYRYRAGITVYLSVLAPVGVFGHAETMSGGNEFFAPPYLEIHDLLDPQEADDPLASLTAAAISASDYRLLSPDEARQPLPEGVQPYEYCMSREPWDRVFHVLFANTD